MLQKLRSFWQFGMSGGLIFGRQASQQLSKYVRKRSLSRVCLITDRNLRRLGMVDTIADSLRSDGLEVSVFDGCVAEPAIEVAQQAAGCAIDCRAECVIGLGGGSNIDVAKIAALLSVHCGQPRDYFGFDRVPGPVLPLIAIPTTAGTGSEVSHSAVLTDVQAGTKVSTLSQWLRPALAIVDPALTDTCPATVTAHSGIDALVHAIEAFTARPYSQMLDIDPQSRAYEGAYPLTEMLAGEAIRRIGRSLVRAVHSPSDRQARDEMAYAATLAGMAFSNSGVAIVHALEYPLGVLTHCSHGEGNGLLLPHVMRFNLPSAEFQFSHIAAWLGCGASVAADCPAELAVERVVELQRSIGIRTRLRELGLAETSIPEIANKAFQIKRLMDINPRRASESDLVAILQSAY